MPKSKVKFTPADFAPAPTIFRSTGIPQLDISWGGGLASGKMIELHGNDGLGKSTVLFQIALNRAHAGDKVLYCDCDFALTDSLKEGLIGSFNGVFSGQGNLDHLCPSSFSDVDRVFQNYLDAGFNLFILDTINMVTNEYDDRKAGVRLSKVNPAEISRLQAELIRIYRSKFARAGATLLVGNQMRQDLRGWRSHLKPCGGRALDHALDIRTRIFPDSKPLSACKSFHKVEVTTTKNRLGRPHNQLPMHIHFASGVNCSEALEMMLLDSGAFEAKRGQYVCPDLPKALHGFEAFSDWVQQNPDTAYELLGRKVGLNLCSPFH